MKIGQSILLRYPVDRNFCRNDFIPHDLENTSNLNFFYFCQKFENSKWPPFLEGGKISGQIFRRNCSILHGLGDTSSQKLQNSRWPPFSERGNFFGIEQSTEQRYPMGQKIRRNRSISHGLEVIKGFVFSALIKILMLN